MAKFNSKRTGVQPTETNFMGEKAFKMEDKEILVSTCMTTFLQGQYYIDEKQETKQILDCLDKVDPLFAAKLALYCRNEGKLRSVSHLIGAYIAKYISGTDWGKRFYNKLVVRPDDMSEVVSCYSHLNGMDGKVKKLPNSIKKGFKEAMERLDAYQIDKYKMKGREISLIDLVNILHPKGNKRNAEAYRRLMCGESLDGLYESKILEKEMSAAGEKAKGKSEEEKIEEKEKAITNVLENVKGMPIMNLVRNLRNILLYAPNKVSDACEQLRIEEKIVNSRLLPFRFATAYGEIEKVTYSERAKKPEDSIMFESDIEKGVITMEQFENNRKEILKALSDAVELACVNIPKLHGKTAILVDHSGSVRGDGGGSSLVSAFSQTNSAMIGNLFGSMMVYSQDNVYIGLFGDKLINVPVDKKNTHLLEFNKKSYALGARCGTSTEAGIYEFMRKVVKEKTKIDNIIVFSDCQIGDGRGRYDYFTSWYGYGDGERSKSFHELFKEFKKINPTALFVVCNLRQSGGTNVFDKSMGIMNIAGWSEKIFDVISNASRGWDEMMKTIEAIEI